MIPYDKMSPHLVEALVATEDERFYEHSGIDFRALGRAIVKRGLMGQANAGGGSTITQQLAKQLYSETASSTVQRFFQKPIEWVIAVKLERYYTKQEIIALYLNYFDFLHNAVGIKTAANTYFNKEPKDLTVCEAATLIGLCKNPSLFFPALPKSPDPLPGSFPPHRNIFRSATPSPAVEVLLPPVQEHRMTPSPASPGGSGCFPVFLQICSPQTVLPSGSAFSCCRSQ